MKGLDLAASSTLRNEGRAGEGRARPTPLLYLVLEADRPAGASARYNLADVDDVVIGRGRAGREAQRTIAGGGRRLLLRVPDRWLSTQHARVVRREGSCAIEDLDSTNGTRVNGVPLIGRRVLVDGDVVEIGHTYLMFRAAVPLGASDLDDVDAAEACARRGLVSLIPSLLERFAELDRVAATRVNVVIGGETGTGKELLARAVHAASRRPGAFIAVNCGALPVDLVEGELFGHREGAFSGADRDRVGLIGASDGGTLFLDEIADLRLGSQAALLRVLEERAVMPVGATRALPVDLRVVCASHADLDALVAAGRFRADLAARLAGFAITLPPLRHRREDLGVVIATILADLEAGEARFDDAAARALLAHDWPRNIRELRTCLEAALALSGGRTIELRHLGDVADAAPALVAVDDTSDGTGDGAPDEARRAVLEALLREHHGNVSAVARALGKRRTQVQRWLRVHGLDAERYR